MTSSRIGSLLHFLERFAGCFEGSTAHVRRLGSEDVRSKEFSTFVTHLSKLCLTSCSQMRMTFHPPRRNDALTFLSRDMFRPIFTRQKAAFVTGH